MRKKHVMHVARARLKLWWNHQISTVCHLWLSACGRNARSLPYFLLPRLSFPRSWLVVMARAKCALAALCFSLASAPTLY